MRKGIVLLILSMFLCSLVLYGCGESAGEAIRKFTFRSPKVAPSDTARLPTATSASGCPPCDCPSATTGNCCCIATEFNDQHGMGEKYWTTRGDCQKDGSGYCSPAGESRTTCTGASTALSTAAASRPDIECCCVATEFNDAHLPGEKYWVATSTCTVQGSGYCAPGVSARSGCTQQLMASGVSIPRD
ncbi:hypothetical protein KY362_07205 [Candidatus Woesearchaeota archaeon]|nr:hypothetical protein [Candidatus Woesearchaeota archaeon]